MWKAKESKKGAKSFEASSRASVPNNHVTINFVHSSIKIKWLVCVCVFTQLASGRVTIQHTKEQVNKIQRNTDGTGDSPRNMKFVPSIRHKRREDLGMVKWW